MLTGLIVARNEENNLNDCLSSLTFCDSIVVVLDRCTDGSEEIARRHADKVILGEWKMQGPRRHAGLDTIEKGWVLEVDADERVPSALASEIVETIRGVTQSTYYMIPFDNYVGNRLVRHGWGAYFGVSAKAALFRAGTKTWGVGREHPKVHLDGEGQRLKERMIHYVDKDISDMLARLDRYTKAGAMDLRDSGDIGTLPRNVLRVFSRFYKCYVRRSGWREGHWGFLIALMAGLYPLLSHLRARLE